MPIPLLIDCDPGIDDAAAICLALGSKEIDLRALVGVGGNVAVDQSVTNIGRILAAAKMPVRPLVGRGLDPAGAIPPERADLYGADGLGNCDLPADPKLAMVDFREAYLQATSDTEGELHVVTLGPLTNLAAMLRETPEIRNSIRHVHVSGGSVWAHGDDGSDAEFNFHRDPAAASAVLSSGLPITVCPLDVTRLIRLDDSHAAHLAASGSPLAMLVSRVLRYAIDSPAGPGIGKCNVSDLVAVGSLLWPSLFLKTRMRLEIAVDGRDAGNSKPALGGDALLRVDLLTAANAVDFLENLLESFCNEAFVV